MTEPFEYFSPAEMTLVSMAIEEDLHTCGNVWGATPTELALKLRDIGNQIAAGTYRVKPE